MKNSEIHDGLNQQELRDFLSIAIVKNYQQKLDNKKLIVSCRLSSTFEWVIEDCKNEIEFQNKRLQLLKEKQAIITLIKMQKWDEFDVSDETEKDLKYALKISFIGTQQEYNDLMGILKMSIK